MLPTLNQTPNYSCTLPESNVLVKFRPFLRKEEKLFLIAKESGSTEDIETTIHQVISNCTDGKLDSSSLSNIDLEFMYLKLRIASSGAVSRIGLRCAKHVEREELTHPIHGVIPAYSGPCNTVNEVSLDLESVVANMPDVKDRVIKLTDSVGIQMSYPDRETLKRHGNMKTEADVMAVVYDCIESIYDGENVYGIEDLEDKESELNAFFDQFNGDQSKKLVDFFQSLPSLTLDINFECKSCGHQDSLTLRGIEDFF